MRSKTGTKRASWVDSITSAILSDPTLDRAAMLELSTLDELLFEAWNLGENIVIAWTQGARELHFLAVRHYELLEPHDYRSASANGAGNSRSFIDAVLVGPKCIEAAEFSRLRAAFSTHVRIVHAAHRFISATSTRIYTHREARNSAG